MLHRQEGVRSPVIKATYPAVRSDREQATYAALADAFADQQFDVLHLGRILGRRWDDRLAKLLLEVNMATGTVYGDRVADALGGLWVPALMTAWLTINARAGAQAINDATRHGLAGAVDHEAKAEVFDQLHTAAEGYARSAVTTAAMLGSHDAAAAGGCRSKTWLASGKSQRHRSMDGVTAPIDRTFSNGMKGPGDPAGGAGEVANCHCSLGYE